LATVSDHDRPTATKQSDKSTFYMSVDYAFSGWLYFLAETESVAEWAFRLSLKPEPEMSQKVKSNFSFGLSHGLVRTSRLSLWQSKVRT